MHTTFRHGQRVQFTQEHRDDLAKAGFLNPLAGDTSPGTVVRNLSGAVYVVRLDTGHLRDVHALNLESVSHPPSVDAVYRCDKLKRGQYPQNEHLVSTHPTTRAAIEEANRLARLDPAHSYVVGAL